MYKDAESEEDFAYLRNYRNMIQGGPGRIILTVNCMYTAAVHFLVLGRRVQTGGGVFRKEIHFLTLFFLTKSTDTEKE